MLSTGVNEVNVAYLQCLVLVDHWAESQKYGDCNNYVVVCAAVSHTPPLKLGVLICFELIPILILFLLYVYVELLAFDL